MTASLFNLSHGMKKLMRNATPQAAMVKANATLMPAMYATRMPGTWSAGNTRRMSVAPVVRSCTGLTAGAVSTTLDRSLLTKPDWAAEMEKAPPTVWKTFGGIWSAG